MKECTRCLFDESIAEIGEHQCEYCDLHDQLESQANPQDLKKVIDAVKKAGKDKKYDCIMGISGGQDSSVLLYTAVRYWMLCKLMERTCLLPFVFFVRTINVKVSESLNQGWARVVSNISLKQILTP